MFVSTAQSMEEEISTFYSTLDNAKAQCKLQDITIVMEILNANVVGKRDGEK